MIASAMVRQARWLLRQRSGTPDGPGTFGPRSGAFRSGGYGQWLGRRFGAPATCASQDDAKQVSAVFGTGLPGVPPSGGGQRGRGGRQYRRSQRSQDRGDRRKKPAREEASPEAKPPDGSCSKGVRIVCPYGADKRGGSLRWPTRIADRLLRQARPRSPEQRLRLLLTCPETSTARSAAKRDSNLPSTARRSRPGGPEGPGRLTRRGKL